MSSFDYPKLNAGDSLPFLAIISILFALIVLIVLKYAKMMEKNKRYGTALLSGVAFGAIVYLLRNYIPEGISNTYYKHLNDILRAVTSEEYRIKKFTEHRMKSINAINELCVQAAKAQALVTPDTPADSPLRIEKDELVTKVANGLMMDNVNIMHGITKWDIDQYKLYPLLNELKNQIKCDEVIQNENKSMSFA
jgi:hypothetical protein